MRIRNLIEALEAIEAEAKVNCDNPHVAIKVFDEKKKSYALADIDEIELIKSSSDNKINGAYLTVVDKDIIPINTANSEVGLQQEGED